MFPKLSAEQRAQGLIDFNDLARENLEGVTRQFEEVVQRTRQHVVTASQSIELAPAV